MKPKTNLVLDNDSIRKLRRNVKVISSSNINRINNPSYHLPYPEFIGVKLTNRCNLRCKHCYQWNDKGHNHFIDKKLQDQDIEICLLEKLLYETRSNKARFYLWGGEPLYHRNFHDIAKLFHLDQRETVICTNGLLLPQYIDDLINMGDSLEIILSLEGFEAENDNLRGLGNFKKVMDSLNMLMNLRKDGIYKGKVFVHMMINDAMSGKLYDFAKFMESKSIDFLIFCFPWYISDDTTHQMDDYFKKNFPYCQKPDKCSWNGFKYSLQVSSKNNIIEQMKKINSQMWNMRIRFQPELNESEIENYIIDNYVENQYKKCLGLSSRIDVNPNGDVSACKQFSEFFVGNLYKNSLLEIWNGKQYQLIRNTIGNNLMPICTKCSNLYVHNM